MPKSAEWEKRARYAEAALRTIIGAPGITLDGAQQIAQNYFDGRDALAASVVPNGRRPGEVSE